MARSIVDLSRKFFTSDACVWLFGSRADDAKKGGDIDIMIEDNSIDNPVEKKINFKLAFENRWGELKIDILIHDTNYQDTAIHEIARQGIRLS
ncbi:nucleotidyltransferase domain-containing protein [Shewanella sp. 202IG2-18]|uniref:nucleotidyltransferase domain-containing protein n=1 Tax=Parashewanella hymeniacidonis TaxID=2807618 RepID=UPI0019606C1D|nr:nucleotidyltransferase domain-containing protein [Parashewanella hymeniacidonis]MBM7071550.1 nucleotidyltransferase domain-containing protein [Parashewanella hymeniacidonis]